MGMRHNEIAKEITSWRLKKLKSGSAREKNIFSTVAKMQKVKKLLSAKKTQAIWKTIKE